MLRKTFVFLKKIFKKIFDKLVYLGQIIKYRLRVKEYLAKNPQPALTSGDKKKIRTYYKALGFGNISTEWHKFYCGVYGEKLNEFIPNTIFFTRVEPFLNRMEFEFLQDKNILDRLFKNVEQPITIFKNINGFYYSESDQPISLNEAMNKWKQHEKVIIKPSLDTGGGKNVKLLTKNTNNDLWDEVYLKELLSEYKNDFIVQEVLEQSDFMSSLNPTSLNTIRIASYLGRNGADILHAIVRMGAEGMATDNISSGGTASTLDDQGKLDRKVCDTYKITVEKTINGLTLDHYTVPNYKLVKEKVKELHYQIPYFRLVSWDIALNKEDLPVLIEYNVVDQGIDSQARVGPFLGKYTNEILESMNK